MEGSWRVMGILSRFWPSPQEQAPGIAAVHPPKGPRFTHRWHLTLAGTDTKVVGSGEVHCRQERQGALQLRPKNHSPNPALSSE